jgi:predicted TIM-barrel fold metal-dependent hydrolase
MIAFASIDPHKGKMRRARGARMVEEYGVKGFKFHPPMQDFHPYDRMAGRSTR